MFEHIDLERDSTIPVNSNRFVVSADNYQKCHSDVHQFPSKQMQRMHFRLNGCTPETKHEQVQKMQLLQQKTMLSLK
jgi:hypothetical protein